MDLQRVNGTKGSCTFQDFCKICNFSLTVSRVLPRNTGELTPAQQPSANGKWESVDKCQDLRASRGGTLRCFLHSYSEGPRCFLLIVVINSTTPPLSDSLSFMSHLLYSFILTLRANLSNKIPAATSYLRFSFEENQNNIPGMLNILLLFFP